MIPSHRYTRNTVWHRASGAFLLATALVVLAWSPPARAACDDPPAPGVDYAGCVIPDDIDGSADGILDQVDLSGADLTGAQIPNRLAGVDLRGARLEGVGFRIPSGDVSNEEIRFENQATRFFDDQAFFLVWPTFPGSGDNLASLFIKGIGMIGPANDVLARSESNVSIERKRASGVLVPGDIAPIRYAVSVLDPWASDSRPSGFGFRERWESTAVTASSNSNTAHYVVDGIASDDGWLSQAEASPWWQMDLGAHFRIEEVVLRARGPGSLDALRGAVLIISDYPLPPEPLAPRDHDSVARFSALAAPSLENRIPLNRTARYLRLEKPRAPGQTLGFDTIELVGFLADAAGSDFTPDFPPPADAPLDPLANVPPVCIDNLFAPDEARPCTFPSPSELLTGEILLTDPELDFSHCDLSDAILTNTSFTVLYNNGALEGVFDLRGADLSGADLRGANLSQVELDGANLRGANLTGAGLVDADITGADFRGAILDGVNFGEVKGNSCALFSNELPLTLEPAINDEPGLPRPRAIVESANVGYGYARQSSTDNDGVPSLALDDSLVSAAQTTLEPSPWWELDMGAVYNIESIEALLPASEPGLDDAVLLVSDWPMPNEPMLDVDGVSVAAYPLAPVPGASDTATAAVQRTGRYLRIQKPDLGGVERRLGLSNVKVSASPFPVPPSSFVPLSAAQRDRLGAAGDLQALMTAVQGQLGARGDGTLAGDLSALQRDTATLRELLERSRGRFREVRNLGSAISAAQKTLRLAKLYRPLRRAPQVKKLEDSLERAEKIAKALTAAFGSVEAAAASGRFALSEISASAGSTSRQMLSALRYLDTGANYMELNLRCALYDGDAATFLPVLNSKIADDVPRMEEYLAHLAADQEPRTHIVAHHEVIRATLERIEPIEAEIDALYEAVSALDEAFASVFAPLVAIGEALAVEIDFGLFDLSAAEVLEALDDAISAIPGLDEAEAAVSALLDPLLQPLLDAIDVLPDFGLPGVPLDGLEELMQSFIDSIDVPDPFVYDLPELGANFDELADVACDGVARPRLWPKEDEDLDGDGLPNGVELKRVTPDPYPGKLETLASSADTDRDGLGDYFEVAQEQFVPTTADANGEVDADHDGDGLSNLEEFLAGTDPFLADTDGDGLPDPVEIAAQLDARRADSDGNGTPDAAEDTDGDGLPNGVEVAMALSIANPGDADLDADEDGVSNRVEIERGTEVNNAPPAPANDSARVHPGGSVTIDLLANDAATDGDPIELLADQIAFPERGTWSIDDGVVTFVAGGDFDGLSADETLSFVYRVRDPGGPASALATVTVSSAPARDGRQDDAGHQHGGCNATGAIGLHSLVPLLVLVRRRRSVERSQRRKGAGGQL